MKILATFPGRFGDILWAMPTLRCLAEASGEPVDLLVGEEFDSFCALLRLQPYLDEVQAIEGWTMDEKRPRMRQRDYAQVIHLAYPEWPTACLPQYTWQTAEAQYPRLPPLDLDTPWITVPDPQIHPLSGVYTAWTEEWIELKMGVLASVAGAQECFFFVHSLGGRHEEFHTLGRRNIHPFRQHDWLECARLLERCDCYLGCLSAHWVLANALGKQTVIVEPSEARQNEIFWYAHPRNHMVIGGDGKPTFHALHVRDTLREVLDG